MSDPSSPDRRDLLDQFETQALAFVQRARRLVGERARLVHPDLHSGEYIVLRHLEEAGAARASALCVALETDKALMSRQVQHLTQLGFIQSEPDPDDGRAQLLSVSESGRQRLALVAKTRRDQTNERLVGWEDADLRVLVEHLRRYNRAQD